MKTTILKIGFIGCFLVLCTAFGKYATPTVEAKKGGAYLTYAEKFGGDISLKELHQTTELGVAGCAAGSLITKFTLKINAKGESIVFHGNSHELTDEMISSFKLLTKNDSFEFKKVTAKLPNGKHVDVVCRKFSVV